MHLICIYESFPDTFPKFCEWLQKQSHGHGHPMVREMKIVDIAMKEQDANYWAALLSKNVGFFGDYTRHDLPKDKLEKVAKWVRRLTPLEDHKITIDEKLVEILPSSFQTRPGDWVYLYPLGKLKDKFDGSGIEVL